MITKFELFLEEHGTIRSIGTVKPYTGKSKKYINTNVQVPDQNQTKDQIVKHIEKEFVDDADLITNMLFTDENQQRFFKINLIWSDYKDHYIKEKVKDETSYKSITEFNYDVKKFITELIKERYYDIKKAILKNPEKIHRIALRIPDTYEYFIIACNMKFIISEQGIITIIMKTVRKNYDSSLIDEVIDNILIKKKYTPILKKPL